MNIPELCKCMHSNTCHECRHAHLFLLDTMTPFQILYALNLQKQVRNKDRKYIVLITYKLILVTCTECGTVSSSHTTKETVLYLKVLQVYKLCTYTININTCFIMVMQASASSSVQELLDVHFDTEPTCSACDMDDYFNIMTNAEPP